MAKLLNTIAKPGLRVERSDDTLRSRVQEVLRSSILDGYFKPGEKLVERELTELTGVSRSILREALVHLEANGLIERHAYRGFSVAKIAAAKIREIYELRASLETLAAELFTERAGSVEIAALKEAFEALEAGMRVSELPQIREATTRYYDTLFEGCRNVEIRRALENVIDRIFYLRTQSMLDLNRREASLAEMRNLTAALLERDRIAARTATLVHVEAARDAVLERLIRDGTKASEHPLMAASS